MAPLPSRPHLSFDGVVIGGGIAGAAVGLALADRGLSVAVVDEGTGGGEATILAGALLAPQFSLPVQSPLFPFAMEGFRCFPDYASELGNHGGRGVPMRWNGMLVANLDETHSEAARAIVARHRALGLHAELVDPCDAVQAGAPKHSSALSYIWFPDAGLVPGFLLAEALCRSLASAGVSLIRGQRARRVVSRGGRATGVELAGGGRLGAGFVVVAAGLGSPAIAGIPRRLSLTADAVHVLRGQTWRPRLGPVLGTPEGSWVGRLPVGQGIAAQLGGGLRPGHRPADEVHGSLHATVDALLGTPSVGVRRSYRGLLAVGADRLPIVGLDPDVDGLAYAVAYGGCGLLLAPVFAAAVASDLLTASPTRSPELFRPGRFAPV